MRKVLVTLLGLIVALGVLAGAGFVGYRMGYNQAARAVNKTAQLPPQDKNQTLPNMPMLHNFERGFGLRGMPMHNFGDGFHRGFGPGGMMMGRGRGFGFFGPIQFLVRIAVFALIIWVIYKLFKGSGWTLTRRPAQVIKTETEVVEPKTE